MQDWVAGHVTAVDREVHARGAQTLQGDAIYYMIGPQEARIHALKETNP